MKTRANGIEVHYRLDGPPKAPVVMLSSSLATTYALWNAQLPVLIDRYRVLRYDTRGHGGTEAPPPPYTLAQLAEDVCALLDALGIDQVHWVGISLGGMIGQTLALEHPERVASLALCDTTSRIPPEALPGWEERIRIAETAGMEPLVEPTIERWFTPEFCTAHARTVDQVRAMIRSTPVAGYVGCCRAIMDLDLTGRLAAIGQPTLVVVGENDPGTPLSAAETIRDAIRGAHLVVLPRARHLSNIEAAAEFNDALTEHLAAVA